MGFSEYMSMMDSTGVELAKKLTSGFIGTCTYEGLFMNKHISYDYTVQLIDPEYKQLGYLVGYDLKLTIKYGDNVIRLTQYESTGVIKHYIIGLYINNELSDSTKKIKDVFATYE